MYNRKYIELLNEVLLSFGDDIFKENWILQHDNIVHSSKKTSEYLGSKNVAVLEVSTVCLDLNPIDNVWAILS